MPATTPEQIHPLFLQAFNGGDVDALMGFYADDAAVVAGPGQVLRGTEQVRGAVKAFLELGRLDLESKLVATVGDVAYLSCTWSLTGTGPDGQSRTVGATSVEVAQRQSDGIWRYIIDSPWGDGTAIAPR